MAKWEMMTGNKAAAVGAKLARVQVIPAYPITPQTTIVEYLSKFVEQGELKAEFIRVESEHSAMAACIGAAAGGVRAFTATSSHGLLLMAEMVFWAAGARLPIGMAVVNRALAPPWNIHVEHTDSHSQRDSGFIQFYAKDNQEVLDTIILMYKVAEDERVLLPAMVCLDGFILSHTYMPVEIPDQEDVDAFLPPYEPKGFLLDPDKPLTYGSLALPDHYMEMRYDIQRSIEAARDLILKYSKEYKEIFGRDHGGLLETYKVEDADYLLISMGTLGEEAKVAADTLRKDGIKAGAVRVRVFRPFPTKTFVNTVSDKNALIVVERHLSLGGIGGALGTELKALLYGKTDVPIFDYVTGLGGRDTTYLDLAKIVKHSIKTGKPEDNYMWYNLKIG
ncbi:MAG: pyruvate ferredoxin oxidoreductase [Thermoproteota archaeon]|nr:MAG: pyruvate ferredoxin oxidoreductase [Candidatus Korarchaeota archaeon]